MKYTEKDLLKAMGLKVGDLVRITSEEFYASTIYQVTKKITLQNIRHECDVKHIHFLLSYEFEIIKQTGTYENVRCTTHIDCENCPLRMIKCDFFNDSKDPNYNSKLKNIWKNIKENMKNRGYEEDKDINCIIEQRLDQYIVDEKLRKLVEQDVEQNTEQIEKGEK